MSETNVLSRYLRHVSAWRLATAMLGALMLFAPLSLSAQWAADPSMANEWRGRDKDKDKDKDRDRQDRDDDDDDRYGNDRDRSSNAGYQNGYNDGYEQGRYDRSSNRRSSGQVRGKNDTRGYDKSMGNKGQYKKAYRSGFSRGYQDGYNGRNSDWGGWGDDRRRDDRDERRDDRGWPGNNRPHSSELHRIAEQNGYADGQWYAQREPNSNPQDTKGYRDADRGYSSALGSKSEYQSHYRAAFLEGFRSRGSGGHVHRDDSVRGDGRYGTQLETIANRNGYDDGVWYAQREPNANPTDTKGYRDADRGYTSSLGSKSEFQRIYRAAFVEGFNSRGRGGIFGGVIPDPRDRGTRSSGNTLQVQAEARGYASGVWYAQKDMREGRRADPTGAKGYQDADDGYSSSLGSKSEYQRFFRAAFMEGYNRTYR